MDFSYIFRYNMKNVGFLLERDVKYNMYERSAIVLERYIEKIFEFDKQHNLKSNLYNFRGLIEEIENYQILSEKEGKIIQEFDDTVKKIEVESTIIAFCSAAASCFFINSSFSLITCCIES